MKTVRPIFIVSYSLIYRWAHRKTKGVRKISHSLPSPLPCPFSLLFPFLSSPLPFPLKSNQIKYVDLLRRLTTKALGPQTKWHQTEIKTNILNKSKNKKEKRLKPEQGMWTILWDAITEEGKRWWKGENPTLSHRFSLFISFPPSIAFPSPFPQIQYRGLR